VRIWKFGDNVNTDEITPGRYNVTTLKACGIASIIAFSFARIFYRNAVNLGLPVFVSQDIPEAAQDGDTGEIDLVNYTLRIGDKVFTLPRPPPFVIDIVQSGGVINFLKNGGTLG